jgi:hypothetical protein
MEAPVKPFRVGGPHKDGGKRIGCESCEMTIQAARRSAQNSGSSKENLG